MKALFAILTGLVIAASVALTASCGSIFTGDGVLFPGAELPIEIGVQYELEPDLFIQVLPGDKGGLEVKIVGEGQLSEHIKKIPGGFEIASPLTGLVYHVTEGANAKPRIMIQPIPPSEAEPDPGDEALVVDLRNSEPLN